MSPTELTMQWVEVSNPKFNRKLPQWARRAGMDQHGTVYLPAIVAGGEMEVLLVIGTRRDARVIEVDEHIYVPVEILTREFPQDAAIFQRYENNVRECIRKKTAGVQ